MPSLDFSSLGSWSSRGHKAKRIVRAGSRINRSLAYEAQAVRVHLTYFSLVIPEDCQIRQMITPATGKELIDPAYTTDRRSSGGRIN